MGASEVTLIAFASFSLVACAVGLVVRDLTSGRKAQAVGGSGAAIPIRLRREQNVFDQAIAKTWSGRIDQAFDRLILETGYELSPGVAFLMLVFSGLLAGGIVWLCSDEPLAGVAGGLSGMAVPLVCFAIRRTRRMWAIRQQLPDVLDMLARVTRAGRSVEQAMEALAEDAGGVLGREFRICSQQMQMGRSFERVLKSLANRLRLVELRLFTSTLIVQRRTGGHLSDTLERMANVVRDRLTAQRQIRAATGAGRMSTMVIASIAPVAYLVVFAIQPKHLAVLYEDALGKSLLLAAMVLEIIGLVWVFALLRRDD